MKESKIISFEHLDANDKGVLLEIIDTWLEIYESNKNLPLEGDSEQVEQNITYAEGLMKVMKAVPPVYMHGIGSTITILKDAVEIANSMDISKLPELNTLLIKVKSYIMQ